MEGRDAVRQFLEYVRREADALSLKQKARAAPSMFKTSAEHSLVASTTASPDDGSWRMRYDPAWQMFVWTSTTPSALRHPVSGAYSPFITTLHGDYEFFN